MQFSRTIAFFNITVDTVMEAAIKVLLLNWASGTKTVQKSLTFKIIIGVFVAVTEDDFLKQVTWELSSVNMNNICTDTIDSIIPAYQRCQNTKLSYFV